MHIPFWIFMIYDSPSLHVLQMAALLHQEAGALLLIRNLLHKKKTILLTSSSTVFFKGFFNWAIANGFNYLLNNRGDFVLQFWPILYSISHIRSNKQPTFRWLGHFVSNCGGYWKTFYFVSPHKKYLFLLS